MRNIILGLTILGALAVAPGARAAPTHQSMVHESMIQRVDFDNCGPRCQQHAREVRAQEERERHSRMEEHRRPEEHRDSQRWARTAMRNKLTAIFALLIGSVLLSGCVIEPGWGWHDHHHEHFERGWAFVTGMPLPWRFHG
jgi:hypothetical protein